MKVGRRTVPPARALALAGYGKEYGARNWEIVKGMTKKERLKWLFIGEGEEDKSGIVVGATERMEGKGEWPGQL